MNEFIWKSVYSHLEYHFYKFYKGFIVCEGFIHRITMLFIIHREKEKNNVYRNRKSFDFEFNNVSRNLNSNFSIFSFL